MDIQVATGKGFIHSSAEFVSPGHPDRTADGISALVVETHISHHPEAHIAAETLLTSKGPIIMAGEITSAYKITPGGYKALARKYIHGLGWTKALGYDPDKIAIQVLYNTQSVDIAQGVEKGKKKIGAGDQGITTGYAIRKHWLPQSADDLMPLPIVLSRDTLFGIDKLRRTTDAGKVLKPDMKSEFIISYNAKGRPVQVERIVLAISHTVDIGLEEIRKIVQPVIDRVLAQHGLSFNAKNVYINGTGRFIVAGAPGDTGLTGRKLVIDHYGPSVPIGGGAIHGKDPSKTDATGAQMARWVAKQIVGNDLADQCFVVLTWAIGYPAPLKIIVDFARTEKKPREEIIKFLQTIDWSLVAAIDRFGLRRLSESNIKYPSLAAWGPFGRVDDGSARPWETVVEIKKWKNWRV
ncbi:methionine adenosyltransferase domain-containing protein [Candidatus Gottesmanbacteria bacterium]|nr:methionine adenosyltransferase domain-containing protein [Candidatus Gottesmanbacteria bacterium]